MFAVHVTCNWDVNICCIFYHKLACLCFWENQKLHQVHQTHKHCLSNKNTNTTQGLRQST